MTPNNNFERPPLLKNKKAVVVEISPQDKIPVPATVIARTILPSMDYDVVADAAGSPLSTNAIATTAGGGDDGEGKNRTKSSRGSNKKSKKNRNKQNHHHLSSNESLSNTMNTGVPAVAAATTGAGEFATNAADGASALALLGQYSYASPTSHEGSSYDGYHHHQHHYNAHVSGSEMMMTTGGEGGYYHPPHHDHHAQYPSSSGSSYNNDQQQLPYYGTYYCPYDATSTAQIVNPGSPASTTTIPAATVMPIGYCIPVMMNGAVYYQQYGAATENAQYYYHNHHHPGYSPQEMSTMDQHASSYYYYHHHNNNYHPNQPNECTDPNTMMMALNIHAPSYNPE